MIKVRTNPFHFQIQNSKNSLRQVVIFFFFNSAGLRVPEFFMKKVVGETEDEIAETELQQIAALSVCFIFTISQTWTISHNSTIQTWRPEVFNHAEFLTS